MLKPIEVLQRYPAHDGTLYAMFESRAGVLGTRDFLLFGEDSYSYSASLQRIRMLASLLARDGVRAGQRIGVMSANCPGVAFLLLALARLGATMVPVNPDYGVNEARYVLTHAKANGIFCASTSLDTVTRACAERDDTPWIKCLDDVERDLCGHGGVSPENPAEASAVLADAHSDDICIFVYTSGTTGFPKGVMHSQHNVVLGGEGFVERMHLQPADRLLCVMPMFHVNAIFYSLAGTLAAGATLVLEPRFSASRFWQTARESGATEVNLPTAAMNILMRRPRAEFVSEHSIAKLYGGPLSPEMYKVFREDFHVGTLIEGYGMSEIPGALNNPFRGPHRIGSMGLPSLHPDYRKPFAEMKVVDDHGRELPAHQVGELHVRTPTVMKGYFRDPEQTTAAFRDGWFMTGDLARTDNDGYFWFVGRKKDIIRRRGENVSGAEIDLVVASHPSVLDAAAIAVPSELGEDEILVAVMAKPGAQISAGEIGEWCRQRLAKFKVPRYVVFVDAFPLTPTQRVAKFKLKADATLLARAIDLQA